MKKIILSIIVLFATGTIAKAQVAIGKPNVTNESVSLEFSETENRGLVLPYISDRNTITTDGTLIYDTTDHKVKYLKSGVWTALSNDDSTQSTIGVADLEIQDSKVEQATAKTAIGTTVGTDTTPGILVLTDTNKAMVLPRVASPHLNIINPAPGMMAYDTVKKQLAVYNGTSWTFWKP